LIQRGFARPTTTLYTVLKVVSQLIIAAGLFLLWEHFEVREDIHVDLQLAIEILLPGLMFISLFLVQPALFVVRKLSIASRTQSVDQNYLIDFLQVVTELGILTLVTLTVFGTLLCWKIFKNAELKFSSICALPWIYGGLMITLGTLGNFSNFKQAVAHYGGQPNLPWLNDVDLKVLMEMS